MPTSLTMAEAKAQLGKLPEILARKRKHRSITVRRAGKPVLTILPYEEYESILETMEILADEEAMKAIRADRERTDYSDTLSMEEVKERLGL